MAHSTGRSYVGVDVGMTYNWYSGQSNFFWPINEIDPLGHPISTNASFDGLGSGVGILFGVKRGLALSNSVDVEGKLQYFTNYTTKQENHTIEQGYDYDRYQAPVTNSYSLTLGNLNLDLLAHVALTNMWYAAGGISFSTLLSNHLYANQALDSGYQYGDGLTALSIPDTEQQNFFASTRLGLVVGGGAVFTLGVGAPLLDAEFLVNIPMNDWIQNGGSNQTVAAESGLPSIIFPKLWYATLTIGIRFFPLIR
jgi:hypothetical protein